MRAATTKYCMSSKFWRIGLMRIWLITKTHSLQKRKRIGARRLAWGYLHTVDRAGKPNVGVLADWSPTAEEKDEDVVTSVQLYAYQPDDVAARWQRPIFGLGTSPNNVFHEEPYAQGAVVEAYAQYRYARDAPTWQVDFQMCSWTIDTWVAQKAEASSSRRSVANTDVCSIRRRCAGRGRRTGSSGGQ
jgi:hypothetical protein